MIRDLTPFSDLVSHCFLFKKHFSQLLMQYFIIKIKIRFITFVWHRK